MDRLFNNLAEYCEAFTTPASDLLNDLDRETHLKTLAPQMLSGKLQGRLLSMISKLVKPAMILEIGTFTGYSAICLAEGLTEEGELHTIEANPELRFIIDKYVGKAGLADRIHVHIGQAQEIIPTLEYKFDLIFIDAGKTDYVEYYKLLIDKVKKGGLIIADNVLWSGKVLDKEKDAETKVLHEFNRMVQEDERVENLMLLVRDGLMIARKLK